MARLTHIRLNGIKRGYWSPEKKEDVVQRLGAIEHSADDMAQSVCENYCIKRALAGTQAELEEQCEACPLRRFMNLVYGE